METIIRKAQLSDICDICRLGEQIPELEVVPGGGFASVEEIHSHFSRKGTRLVALDRNDNVVGFVIGSFGDPDAPVVPYACLVYAAVAPDFRGKGLGRELMRQCRAALYSQGAKTVYAWARADFPVEKILATEGFVSGNLYRWMECGVTE